MADIYDLKTVQVKIDNGALGKDLDIGAIPLGKTRYVVWVKFWAPTENVVSLGSTDGPTATLDVVKDVQGLGDKETIAYPDVIDPNACIFSIEGTTKLVYLGVTKTPATQDTEMTLVYFDE